MRGLTDPERDVLLMVASNESRSVTHDEWVLLVRLFHEGRVAFVPCPGRDFVRYVITPIGKYALRVDAMARSEWVG